MDVKFLVDANVGRLVKWLRALGYDTAFVEDADDNEIIRRAFHEGRVVLTRDTQIMKRGIVTSGRVKALMIADDDSRCQLRQVYKEMGLDVGKAFSLCLECNESISPVPADSVAGQVPPYVYRTQHQYSRCPRCGRVYWKGTHWQRMTEEIEKLQE